MNAITIWVPEQLQSRVDARLADGDYIDAGDYVRDLIRRDLAEAARCADVRALIAEGDASGICGQDDFKILDEIIADVHRHG